MMKKPTKATIVRYFTRWLREQSADYCKEIKLWRGVLLQLIIDATGYSGHNGGDRYQAWNLLIENRRDFRELCELADVNPDFIRDTVKGVCHGETSRAFN